MAICPEQDADLHMAQLMPLPLTVSCFSKIQIGFTFLVLAHLGSPGKRAVKRVCVSAWQLSNSEAGVKTEKSGGVAGGEGECRDDAAWLLARERRSLDILPVK